MLERRLSSVTLPERLLDSAYNVIDGISIHSIVAARHFDDAMVPVVFVHGLGVSLEYLEPTMRKLAPRHLVAGLDLPGFGRSGTPLRALDVHGLAAALEGWLEARHLAPAVFVGNSYGCQVIVELATRSPARVRGLVLNAPTMDPAHRTIFGQLIRVIADIPFEPWRLAWIVARNYLRAGPLRLLATLRFALSDHIEEKLPAISVPVAIVTGVHDPVVTVDWASEAARLVGMSSPGAPGATLHVLPHAAHALPYDDPATFAALIESFLDTLPPMSPPV